MEIGKKLGEHRRVVHDQRHATAASTCRSSATTLPEVLEVFDMADPDAVDGTAT